MAPYFQSPIRFHGTHRDKFTFALPHQLCLSSTQNKCYKDFESSGAEINSLCILFPCNNFSRTVSSSRQLYTVAYNDVRFIIHIKNLFQFQQHSHFADAATKLCNVLYIQYIPFTDLRPATEQAFISVTLGHVCYAGLSVGLLRLTADTAQRSKCLGLLYY